jgi:hypothetical protein
MTRRSLTDTTCGLLMLALAPMAHGDDGIRQAELRLFLHTAGTAEKASERHLIRFDAQGRERLERLYHQHYRGGRGHGAPPFEYRQGLSEGVAHDDLLEVVLAPAEAGRRAKSVSIGYQVVRSLFEDPTRVAALREAGGQGKASALDIHFRLHDAFEDLHPGAVLQLPGGGTATMQEGEDIWDLAERVGVLPQELEWANHRTLEIWPHQERALEDHAIDGHHHKVARVNLGERAFETTLPPGGPKAWAWETLLHEAAHASDASPFLPGDYFYGPDGGHWLDEVISPKAAFGEGWANGLAAHFSGTSGGPASASIRGAALAPESLRVERLDGSYASRPLAECPPEHRLANEVVVARIVYQSIQTFGEEAVYAALRRTQDEPGRHVVTFLAGLAAEVDRPSRVASILARESGLSEAQATRHLESGGLPGGVRPGDGPWNQEGYAVPPPEPAPAPRAPQHRASRGLFGLPG